MKPTKITNKEILPGTKSSPRGLVVLTCNDGNQYTLQQLASKLKRKRVASLYEHIRRVGWRNVAL